MKHSKFLLLILIFFCQLAMSQTNGLVEVKGMGGQTCAQYIEHKKSAPPLLVQLYAQWAQGFISGYNIGIPTVPKDRRLAKSPVSVPDEDTIHLYLDKYCRDTPLGYITEGVFVLIKELGERSNAKTNRAK